MGFLLIKPYNSTFGKIVLFNEGFPFRDIEMGSPFRVIEMGSPFRSPRNATIRSEAFRSPVWYGGPKCKTNDKKAHQ